MNASHSARPLFGIALKIVSTIAFAAMATLIKLASDRYPVGELVFFRSFFALIPVLAWVAWLGHFRTVFKTSTPGGHFLRSIAGTVGMFCGFTALSLLPIADATAIGYASPLFTVAFAVVLLHEKVHIYRWTAVVVGLLGILVILSDYVGPEAPADTSGTHTLGALVAIVGSVAAALAATQVRVLVRTEHAATIVVYFSLFTSLFALVTVPFGWLMPDPLDALQLVAAGICGGVGQVLLTQSYRYGEASVIAPFEYVSMIWVLVASLVIFSVWPSGTVLIGSAIVIGAGLFIIFRERQLGIRNAKVLRAETPTNPLS
jgi:drug/metabolite transporter (DMT)-like permease